MMTQMDNGQMLDRREELEKVEIDYPVIGPFMDTSVPSTMLNPGTFGLVAGADPRFKGALVRFPGMASVSNLGAGITAVSQFFSVSFINLDNNTLVIGYLHCMGDGELYLRIGSTNHVVYDSGIDASSKIDAVACRDMLYVVCEGKDPKVIYYDTGLKIEDMGPGEDFGDTDTLSEADTGTGALTGTENTHYMQDDSVYRVAYRFYHSRRDMYSAMSQSASVVTPENTEEYLDRVYKVDVELPADVQLLDPAGSFDTIEWYRSIPIVGGGEVLYLELTEDLTANTTTYTLGTVMDDGLVLRDTYDELTDAVKAVPKGSAIGRYQGYTFVNHPISDDGGYKISHSDATRESPEYFGLFNERKGEPSEGRPLRFINAGDYMIVPCTNSIIHVSKLGSRKDLQYLSMHFNRGLVNRKGIHAAGNSVFMITAIGLVVLDANSGDMHQVTAADGIMLERWVADLEKLEMAYDTDMNATFILNPVKAEALMLGHTVQAPILLENMPFAHLSGGLHADGDKQRAYFVTADGRITAPDSRGVGSGNMMGFSATSGTLAGEADVSGTDIVLKSTATLDSTWAGARVYVVTEDNEVHWRVVDSVVTENDIKKIRCTATFGFNGFNVRYAVSPVVFKAKFWSLAGHAQRYMGKSTFDRYKIKGLAIKAAGIVYPSTAEVPRWIIGVHRNGKVLPESGLKGCEMDTNPSDSVVALEMDGVDLEPMVWQIGSNLKFKLLSISNNVIVTNSRKVTK